MLVAAVLLLVIALAAGALFLVQRNDAQEAARLTKVRELAGESTLALTIDPELSTLLALEAVKLSRQGGDAAANRGDRGPSRGGPGLPDRAPTADRRQ